MHFVLYIIYSAIILLTLCGSSTAAVAEKLDLPPSVPVPSVQGEALSLPAPDIEQKKKPAPPSIIPIVGDSEGVVVLELFSTPACPFCPKADALMKEFAGKKGIIALSCHVDYFDVKAGSLSLPICSSRQSMYERSLDRGPKYTPQMVLNGREDAIGYLMPEINEALARVSKHKALELNIINTGRGIFLINLPAYEEGEYAVWLFPYYAMKSIEITDGANSGKTIEYYNLVASAGFLGNWDGRIKILKFDPKLTEDVQSFALIVQDKTTSHIIAAAQFEQ